MIRFYIRAIGKLKNKFISGLIAEYKSRLVNFCDIQELEVKKSINLPTNVVKTEEGRLLIDALHPNTYKIALDETGDLLSSHQLAELIEKKSLAGYSSFTFFIGGADGLDPSVKTTANKIISFGRITLPHMLARLVLVEQIYRIEKILTNHPYDK